MEKIRANEQCEFDFDLEKMEDEIEESMDKWLEEKYANQTSDGYDELCDAEREGRIIV